MYAKRLLMPEPESASKSNCIRNEMSLQKIVPPKSTRSRSSSKPLRSRGAASDTLKLGGVAPSDTVPIASSE